MGSRSLLLAAAMFTIALPPAAQAAPRYAPAQRSMLVDRPCASAQLKAVVASDEHAMMHRELRIALTNTSTRPCTIDGYPAVRLMSAAKTVLISAELFSGTPRPFALAPNDKAAFGLRVAVGDGVATYAIAPMLAIIPPGDVAPLTLDVSLPVAPTLDVTTLERY